MEVLLTPEQLETQQSEEKVGKQKVDKVVVKTVTWEKNQKQDLQGQYDLAVYKINYQKDHKEKRIKLSSARLRAKESLESTDAYYAELLEYKKWKKAAKVKKTKISHNLDLRKIKDEHEENLDALQKTYANKVENLKSHQDKKTVVKLNEEKFSEKEQHAQLMQNNREVRAQEYHEKQLVLAKQTENHKIKLAKKKYANDENALKKELDKIHIEYEKMVREAEEGLTKRIADSKVQLEKDFAKINAKHREANDKIEHMEFGDYKTRLQDLENHHQHRLDHLESSYQTKVSAINEKDNNLDKKLALKEEKLTARNQKCAQKAHDRYANKKPLTPNKLKKLKAKNDAIIADLLSYQKDCFANYDHKIDLLTQNLNQGMTDLTDGSKSTIDQETESNIDKINRKYDKANFIANYKKNSQKYIENDNWNRKTRHELAVSMYEKSNKNYTPFYILMTDFFTGLINKTQLWWLNVQKKFARCREWSFLDWINLRIWGMPLYLYAAIFGILVAVIATGVAQMNMLYPTFILFTIAIIGGTIFSKIPIWNKYIGGAVIGCLFIGAFLVFFNAIPKDGQVYKSIAAWFSASWSETVVGADGSVTVVKHQGQDFLDFYISVVLICAVLIVPRKMLIKALGGFIVVLVIGSFSAVGTGILGGAIMGASPKQTIINYTFPILGSGTGGGINPMQAVIMQNWDGKVPNTSTNWYSHAFAITVIANIFSIILAAILAGVAKSKPELSGNGSLSKSTIHVIEDKPKIGTRNLAGSLVMILGIYVLSTIISNQILTKAVIGITLPNYAWMIIICIVLNLTGIVPADMKAGLGSIQIFVSKNTTWLIMLALGITNIDLKQFVNALSGQTVVITLFTIAGAVFVPMLISRFFGLYPIETALSAGCCMTAQGGAGVIAVLGAANREQLMPYGQITTRIGGSVVLIVASVIFSAWDVPSLLIR